MQRAASRATRLIAWALMVAFAVVLSATCASADDLTPAQKACCAAMGHDCGALAKEQGCCTVESQQVDQSAAAKRMTVLPPVALDALVATIAYDAPSVSLVSHHWRLEASSPGPPGVPRYLLVSSLLI